MQFDDIRPYNDEEYHQIVKKLLNQPVFLRVANMFFPDLTEEKLSDLLLSYDTINQFQSQFICEVVTVIKNRSMNDLIFEGLERINDNTPRMYISNHRDIVLDSALVNYGLNSKGLKTIEIAIGSNLLGVDWVRDLVKLNKSFVVKRNLPIQELLAASKELSEYIKYTLSSKEESIWIAQREGRAKDGNDLTNPGLLKMFSMAADNDLASYFKNLNIMPVAISYEYDPCDVYKVRELMAKARGEEYVKEKGEDEFQMATGINGHKGRVHVNYVGLINEQIDGISHIKKKNEFLKSFAKIIDKAIHENYFVWPNSYIAADLLSNTNEFTDNYTDDEKAKFEQYVSERLNEVKLSADSFAKETLLKMYAQPLFNQLN